MTSPVKPPAPGPATDLVIGKDERIPPGRYLRVLVLAALLGLPAAVLAAAFTSAVHGVESLVWHELPDAAGWAEPPWWFVILVPALAGVVVALATRLPGHGGHAALDGLKIEPVPARHVPGILIAAVASLALGPVVGPEAPLVALGLALGVVVGRAVDPGDERQLLVLAGGFAAISTVFGGPLPSALLMLEIAAMSGMAPATVIGRLLLPGFVASGVGALVFTGIAGWPGVHEISLGIPGLPAYPTVHIVDLLWCLPLAAVVAGVVLAALDAARGIAARIGTPGVLAFASAGALVGLAAVLFRLVADRPVELVLFSGQAATGAIVAEASAGVLLALLVAKGLAFVLSTGGGFRGGLIFPSIALGLALAAIAASVLPGLALTPAVVAAVAAAAAAALSAPFFGALMAALLAGTMAPDTTPIAILAAAVGALIAGARAPAE